MSIIKEFIENNKLDFTGSGSELNSNYCILSGFALLKNYSYDELEQELLELYPNIDIDELQRVFNYADKKNYKLAWMNGKYKGKFIY